MQAEQTRDERQSKGAVPKAGNQSFANGIPRGICDLGVFWEVMQHSRYELARHEAYVLIHGLRGLEYHVGHIQGAGCEAFFRGLGCIAVVLIITERWGKDRAEELQYALHGGLLLCRRHHEEALHGEPERSVEELGLLGQKLLHVSRGTA